MESEDQYTSNTLPQGFGGWEALGIQQACPHLATWCTASTLIFLHVFCVRNIDADRLAGS